MSLSSKVVLITGAGSGIGRAMVERFLAQGSSVVGFDRDEDSLALLERSSSDAGRERLSNVVGDVSSEEDLAGAIAHAKERYGSLDVMCNNAGVAGPSRGILETSVEDWDNAFAVLVRGVFLGTKQAAVAMREGGSGGSVVNTASVAGMVGGAGSSCYAAAKAAVIQFTRYAAVDLASERIRVNAICPGGILTPLAVPRDLSDAQMGEIMDGMQPWPRHGSPDDVAEVAVFLASDVAEFITGADVVVDGGLLASGVDVAGRVRAGIQRATGGSA
ncbi:MAG TPA: SDR family oxidoreductase [Acidimicrobiales bacterium]|nr:SDR family oxidoreductase [Acidimicrobiales bacterium]